MNRKRILKHLVFLMFFLFILNLIAQEFYWYFTIWYFDIIMHFLSGFWVGLFFLYVFYNENLFLKQILTVILGVLLIGVLWEAFEFFLNIIAKEQFNIVDTASDIFFDLLGGLCAILYLWEKQQIKQSE
ncbi:hypothetical protein A2W67_01650 [Candidatus Nomurabacteria bacterium RIFCSPLOWO2_02_40_28]|nr:MAG: hypothetical protein A2W50_00850 [Candidatus Nomurabacteria bacterium RIFCSPHIGHO2_02_40_30]OGI80097.1 MAG: hypothetical protein A2W43_00880 [Candidatus Nomurabacteria bacterium RIFCSPHIGHO2_12_40_11]OGI83623.1 MAG: hypothetical protein A3E33_01740 [Candidatus Nomurabacteria bacterium RIFCSPHIGHO2_12_FULL_40_77]OGI96724.1 MAG: hypothetical protein A2W67_01650 [Candidatus Nomurabacteria bacterium RIFCSPLOWO2_02_40_28]OGI98537.1 MAG: hypothetical protein A2W78_01910 [Candidatus Nomurabact